MKYILSIFCALSMFVNQGVAEMVVIKTNQGDIVVELDEKNAPLTTQNFLRYVDDGFYSGTIFHRVIDNFMIQGGGYTKEMNQKPTNNPIKNEGYNGLKNKRGTIAMARTNDVNSATAQFFINVKDNDFLDHKGQNPAQFGYCVFGKVVQGMDVVDKIKGAKTQSVKGFQDVPVTAVEILSITRKQ